MRENNGGGMKRRHSGHSGHMNNGGMHGGARRPQNRHQGGGQGNNYQQRPRKNYAALREKYMNMAKEAMSCGDRVLGEYYLQHADHYFRMQQEFLAERAQRQQLNPQSEQNDANDDAQDEGPEENDAAMGMPNNSNVMPAFLTRQVNSPQNNNNQGDDKAMAQGSWDEE